MDNMKENNSYLCVIVALTYCIANNTEMIIPQTEAINKGNGISIFDGVYIVSNNYYNK